MPSTLAAAPTFLTVVDLAERYHVSTATIWRWRANGQLPEPARVGPKFVRWPAEAIAQWEIEQGMHGASETAET